MFRGAAALQPITKKDKAPWMSVDPSRRNPFGIDAHEPQITCWPHSFISFFFFVCFESNGKKRRRSRLQQLARWLYTAHLTQSSLSNVTFRKIKRCQHTTCHAKMFSNRKFDCFVSFLKKERKKQMKLVCAAIDNQSESQLAKGKTNGSELTGASLLISIHYVRDNNNSPRSLHFLLRISHLFFIFG